jgi:N-acetylneuraminic acid mutarotase
MVNLQSTSANITFNILPPSISSLSTSNEFIGATIQIIGNNFNPTPEGNNVFFGECNAVILNATKSLLTVQIPNGIYNERSFKVEVQVAEQSALSPESFTLQNAWLRKDVMQPMEERSNAVTFVVNGKGYIGLGSKFGFLYKNFWEYDPVTRVWVSIGDFPDKVRDAAVSFVIGNYAYVGGGYDPYTSEPLFDFWRFEPQFRTWTRVSDLPVAMIWNSISFSAAQKGYVVIGGESDNFWEYNTNGDKWTKKSDFSGGPIRSGGFTLGNNIFVHSSDASTSPNRLDEYSVIADSWFAKADVEDTSFETIALGFSVNGYGYLMGTGRVNKYNPVSDSWTKLPETGPFQVGAFSFVINDKAYLWNSTTLWEFDPDFE